MLAYESESQHQNSTQTQFHSQVQVLSSYLHGEQSYRAFTTFPTTYHKGEGSQYQQSLSSVFVTSLITPILACGSQGFYRSNMSSQPVQSNICGNEDNEDEDGEEEDERQLRRVASGRVKEVHQQELRVLPPRRRRPPPYDISSHHKCH
ncbi:unnamed protein product [Lupinus luteus]|uniref:Uncharacterized protein n=1 Tax=Lupinus luteus TaxID=3873 RepID=A0AAV1XCS5_LUPLU